MPITDMQARRFQNMIREWEAIADFLDKSSEENEVAAAAFRYCVKDVIKIIEDFETGGDL